MDMEFKKPKSKMLTAGKMLGLGGLAGLGAAGITKAIRGSKPAPLANVGNTETDDARAQKIAQILEQQRMEKTIRENAMRLAQSAPDLYSSVMAGQRLPKGSVVLGGRPREDLMRQLAASMDSGQFRKQDPLSDLMG